MSNCVATGAGDFKMIIAPGAGTASFTGTPSNGLRLFPTVCNLGKRTLARQRQALRGTVGMDILDIDPGVDEVGGNIVLEPGRAELDVLLPLILGKAEGTDGSADEFALDNALRPFRAQTQRGDIYTDFQDLYVNTAEFSGSEGSSVQLDLDVFGKTAVDLASATFNTNVGTSVVPSVAARTIAFQEGAFTLDGDSFPISDFTTTVDNVLTRQYYSSKTAQCIDRNGKRVVRYRFTLPLNSTTDTIWTQGYDNLAAALSFIAADSTEFSLSYTALHWPNVMPLVPGAAQLGVILEGLALADGATPELSITNNPVPA